MQIVVPHLVFKPVQKTITFDAQPSSIYEHAACPESGDPSDFQDYINVYFNVTRTQFIIRLPLGSHHKWKRLSKTSGVGNNNLLSSARKRPDTMILLEINEGYSDSFRWT